MAEAITFCCSANCPERAFCRRHEEHRSRPQGATRRPGHRHIDYPWQRDGDRVVCVGLLPDTSTRPLPSGGLDG